jgi:exosortase
MPLAIHKNHLWFLLVLAVSMAVYWTPLTLLADLARKQEHYSHILVIPAVAAFLVFLGRKRIFSEVAYALRPAMGFLLMAILFGGLRLSGWLELSENDSLTLAMLSLVAVWVGGFLACYGRKAARAALFPLVFLALLAPLPDVLLHHTIRILQIGSAEATAVIFKLTGTPVYREGFIFAVPGLTIHVAEECSGIRSSMALFITSLLAAYLFLNSPWRRLVLILAVYPITIVKNGLRIVLLTLVTTNWDPDFLSGPMHTRGGQPFFVLGLMVLLVVLWILRKWDRKSSPDFSPLGGSQA